MVAAGMGTIGLILSPFTGGLSLVFTGVGTLLGFVSMGIHAEADATLFTSLPGIRTAINSEYAIVQPAVEKILNVANKVGESKVMLDAELND